MNEGPSEVKNANLFTPSAWLTKIELIQYLIFEKNVLISVLGELHGGKSSFARILSSHLDPQIKVYSLTASPLFDTVVFLSELVDEFTIQGEKNISSLIRQSEENKTYSLLIIDDAHYLPETFILEILQALEQQNSPFYFHVCFISNETIPKMFNNADLKSYRDRIHTLELECLDEEETEGYVKARMKPLKTFGTLGQEKQINQLYQLTGGSIAGINSQMLGFFNQPWQKMFRTSWPVSLSVIGSTLLLVYSLIYWEQKHSSAHQTMLIISSTPHQASSSKPKTAQVTIPTQRVTPTLAKANSPSMPEILVSEVPAYDFSALREPLVEPNLVHHSSKILEDEFKAIPQLALEKTAEVLTYSKIQTGLSKTSAVRVSYTIQLLASRSKAQLERFAHVHHIEDKTKIFYVHKDNQKWYVLTVGQYNELNSAKEMMERLPKDFSRLKPWVRATSVLQELS